MSRYTNLSKKKRRFLQELILLDKIYNFLSASVYDELFEVLKEGRYLASESEWINKHINNHREDYIKLKKDLTLRK